MIDEIDHIVVMKGRRIWVNFVKKRGNIAGEVEIIMPNAFALFLKLNYNG